MWYLVVSIPDLCTLTYFYIFSWEIAFPPSDTMTNQVGTQDIALIVPGIFEKMKVHSFPLSVVCGS